LIEFAQHELCCCPAVTAHELVKGRIDVLEQRSGTRIGLRPKAPLENRDALGEAAAPDAQSVQPARQFEKRIRRAVEGLRNGGHKAGAGEPPGAEAA
jgi:hypothetical protein